MAGDSPRFGAKPQAANFQAEVSAVTMIHRRFADARAAHQTRKAFMINGVHTIIYAQDADKARAFFRDALNFPSVDAGHGWLIFALPPGEVAAHPTEGGESRRHEMYFMCDDVNKTVAELKRKGVEFTSPVTDQGWGLLTTLKIPGGGEIGLYEPRHPTAINR
jgi:predicted enzyme related to lactoylglutathione lyase